MSTTSALTKAPNYSLHRDATATDGAGAITNKAVGVNTEGYEYVHVQIIPASGANPGATVQWWSQEADEYINEHTAITKAGVGADVPYEFTVQPMGRFMFVKLDAGAKVYVSGYGRRHPE